MVEINNHDKIFNNKYKPPTNITFSPLLLSDGNRMNTESKSTFIAGKVYVKKTFVCSSENSALKEPLSAVIHQAIQFTMKVKLLVVKPFGKIRVGDNVVSYVMPT